jgi:ligand-binding SRPBCC domain-containing protein
VSNVIEVKLQADCIFSEINFWSYTNQYVTIFSVSPDFVREMRDAAVEERKRVQFDVQISGKPLPSLEWFHGDTLLQEDRWIKIRHSTKDNTCSLVIRSATAEMRGVYKCVITNPLDSISCTARLHIEGERRRLKIGDCCRVGRLD